MITSTKSPEEIARGMGHPHARRALGLYRRGVSDGLLLAADEVEKLLTADELTGVLRTWITVVRSHDGKEGDR